MTDAYKLFTKGYQSQNTLEGWDIRAKEYAALPETNRIYRIHKAVLYHLFLNKVWPQLKSGGGDVKILDFNCGCGNDLGFFLGRGLKTYGCDGSVEMLNVAHETHQEEVNSGMLRLYHGQAENLNEHSFDGEKFDCIFSTTGGFSYLDDHQFVKAHEVLSNMLTDNGLLFLAHLTPFCFFDMAYHLAKLRLKKAFRRLNPSLSIEVKGDKKKMYLRSRFEIAKTLKKTIHIQDIYPVVSFTPPFQTGYSPPRWLAKIHRDIELKLAVLSLPTLWSDQVAVVGK